MVLIQRAGAKLMSGKTFYNVNVMAADFNVGAEAFLQIVETWGCNPRTCCGGCGSVVTTHIFDPIPPRS